VCRAPALIALMVPNAGGRVVCPLLLEPQQAALPSVLMPHE